MPSTRYHARNGLLDRYGYLLIFISMAITGGCGAPLPVETDEDRSPGVLQETEEAPVPGFRLENSKLTVSTFSYTTPIKKLSSNPFSMLFLWVKDKGLFIVSLYGPHFAEEAGLFSQNVLQFSCAGVEVIFENEKIPMLSDGIERPAMVTFFSDFHVLPASVEPPNLVLGLADAFKQIPGFEHRNLPPTPCHGPE